MNPPERPTFRPRAGHFWLVVLGAILILAPGAFYKLPSSKAVVGGLRILEGDVPYRDFWSMYAPGQFYATAGLFWLFGRELLVQALATIVLRALSAGIFFRILTRVGLPLRGCLLLSFVFAAMFFETSVELESYPPAVFCILIAMERATACYAEGGVRKLFVAGVALGFAACFKHDVAAHFGVALTAGFFVSHLLCKGRTTPWVPPLRATAALAAGCSCVVLPVIGLLALHAGPAAWHDLIVFPATDFRLVRDEPYPDLLPRFSVFWKWLRSPADLRLAQHAANQFSAWICGNMPEWIFLAGSAWAFARRRAASPLHLAVGVTCLLGMPLYWLSAHVQKNTHMDSMAIFAAVVAASLWVSERWGSRRRFRALGLTVLATYCLGLLFPPAMSVYPVLSSFRRHGWPGGVVLPFDGVRGVLVSPRERDYFKPLGEFIRENTLEDERIHAGVKRHDAVVVGNQRWYVVTGRRPATRYNELHPGVSDRPGVQREMIADLERHEVRCVILWNFGGKNPDWSPSQLDTFLARRQAVLPDTGSTLLDDYIAENFELLAERDEYELLWRKGLPRPPEPR